MASRSLAVGSLRRIRGSRWCSTGEYPIRQSQYFDVATCCARTGGISGVFLGDQGANSGGFERGAFSGYITRGGARARKLYGGPRVVRYEANGVY